MHITVFMVLLFLRVLTLINLDSCVLLIQFY